MNNYASKLAKLRHYIKEKTGKKYHAVNLLIIVKSFLKKFQIFQNNIKWHTNKSGKGLIFYRSKLFVIIDQAAKSNSESIVL